MQLEGLHVVAELQVGEGGELEGQDEADEQLGRRDLGEPAGEAQPEVTTTEGGTST